jgi:hypothetical protein
MGRFKALIAPALFAIGFIVLTAVFASGGSGWLQSFCFYFHLIPFGIGFAGGGNFGIVLYYLILWVVLSILFLGIKQLYILIFKRSA